MNGKTKNLLKWKPEGGFRGLAAVLPSFGMAFAVIAAAGMIEAGCDNLAGAGNGYDEAAPQEASGFAPESAGEREPAADYTLAIRTITVRFKVKNGGWGLLWSTGIVSTQNDSYSLIHRRENCADDFDIYIVVPAKEKYLNIRWKAFGVWSKITYLKAKMALAGDEARNYTIVLDYNGQGKVATKNLYDVSVSVKDVNNDFSNALERASKDPFVFRTITVGFELRNSPGGLTEGMVSTQDDSYIIYNSVSGNAFSITLAVPVSDKYLNVLWRARRRITVTGNTLSDGYLNVPGMSTAGNYDDHLYYIRGRIKPENCNIILNYNGPGAGITANNLDDCESYVSDEGFDSIDTWRDYWENHKARSAGN